MSDNTGWVEQVSVSAGGVPKLAIERTRVGLLGLDGDRQRDRRYHGGPDRAVCLFSLTAIEQLKSEGHPIAPGSIGENLTLGGIDFAALAEGARLRIGDAIVIEVTGYASPCQNIAGSFTAGDYSRVAPKRHPGESRLYARVLAEGEVVTGDPVAVLD